MERLNDIAVFIQVVECGSFTAAAERLGLSKSVVSKYVTRLENGLGARLLNRSTRRMSLTEVGQAFFTQSRRGLDAIEDAEAEVSRLQEAPRGTLKVNVPMSFGILHIAPLLPEFQSLFPDVSIDMTLEDRHIDVIEEGVDLVIRIAEMPDSSLVARRLGPCRHVVCASQEYFERWGVPRVPEDLHHHNAITYKYQESSAGWRFLSPEGRLISVPVSGAIQVNNSLALREILIGGAGITLTPTFIVGADLQAGRLKAALTGYRAPELSIYAVYPQRQHLLPKVRAFVEFVAERINETPYWDEARPE
ncbi:LysR family transcriptional regulator [Marinobacterium arenosum]|uniref:LysR family transcriptional regulator n=1 Tax=Marinobacterium arenosum TaxID=2862496 RepID=UPI001C97C789|nr:LysR family transcriptional regulator [Marinobacterium arenosum]MBY4675490.1 LysR family transcriptional regulator [Marinobacterium arenosum]